jgi:hypothetical protein
MAFEITPTRARIPSMGSHFMMKSASANPIRLDRHPDKRFGFTGIGGWGGTGGCGSLLSPIGPEVLVPGA